MQNLVKPDPSSEKSRKLLICATLLLNQSLRWFLILEIELEKELNLMILEEGSCYRIHTNVCLTEDPGVTSSIPARSDTFMEIDHEVISTIILLPSADAFKRGWCQLQAKGYARITG